MCRGLRFDLIIIFGEFGTVSRKIFAGVFAGLKGILGAIGDFFVCVLRKRFGLVLSSN